MFKNPLKYQQGGQLNEQQQQMLAAFIDWLPKRVKEFQGMKPDAIVQALDGMSKTPEGQKQVQQLMEQFQQELQSVPSAKRGGKIQDFICKHGRGGAVAGCDCEKPVLKGQEAIPGGMPRFQVVRDTTYTNPANRRIMEQVIVGPDGQAYRRTTENGVNPIVIGGYWDGQFTPEGDDTIPVQRFDSLFRRAIPKQKSQNNQNIVKDQNPAGPIPNSSYFGTISSNPTTNPIRRRIDNIINNNFTLRNIQTGFRNFGNSAMGKILGFFMPNPNSETGMLGAAAPIGKVKIIPEGKIGSIRRTNYDPFVWEVIAKDPVTLENAKNLGLKEGSKEWAEFIEKTAKEVDNLVAGMDFLSFKKGGNIEKAQWGGITTGNERTNSNNRGQYWEDLTINPEFGRTYRLNVPGSLLNSTYIRHYNPNGTNKIKGVYSLPDDSWVKWSNLYVPGGKEYEWNDFFFNHMKKNVPQRLSNAQRLVPPMYDVKK